MRSLARGAALSVLGVLFLSSTLFAQSLTVRVGRGNVRSGPGDTYEVIGKVRRGQKFDVEARQGDWFKILLETGREGWVFKSLVEVSGKRSIGVVPSGPAISASRPYGDSWALVVGINRYRKPSLRLSYAVNDARAVVSALTKIGFAQNRITLLEDGQATGLAVRRGFDHLRLNTKPEDRVFIFFAGHGTTVDIPGGGQMGYLIPVDGTVEALLATGIPMNQVRNMARLIPAKHVFFAIDACFAGLMAARETPKPYKAETVSRLTRGRLRQILTAGDRDQRAWEEAGHGLFTRRLLEGLDGEADVSPRDGVLTAMELAVYVQGQVTAITQGKQTPIFAKMEGVGQFVFTAPGIESRRTDGPPPAPVTVKPSPPAPPPVASLPKGTGDLFVSSEPPGAAVFVDGRPLQGLTPLLVERIPAGEHRVLVRKGETHGGFQDVRVGAGELKNLTVRLERLKGELYVKVRPFGSEILVDGKGLGKSPLKVKVNTGRRTLEVRREGYRKLSRTVKVGFGITTEVSDRLTAIPRGTLVVSSTPSGAEIFIGKRSVGKTPRAIRLYEGEYTVRFGKPGYKPTSRKVLVRGDRKSTVVAVLAVEPIPPGMVKVPAGWFIMGSNSGDSDEKPRRRVYLDEFFIDKYPVTNVRFRRFGRPKKVYGSKFNGDRQPVVGVTWFQARDYCASVGKRLPTEAEWEKSARGVDGRKYPWGNSWDGSKVIWSKNSGGKTHPVDRDYNTHRSPYGAVDLVGNTWECAADSYKSDYDRNAPDRNPKGPSSGSARVVRGGSWDFHKPTWFRAADRNRGAAGFRNGALGFRCAKASK